MIINASKWILNCFWEVYQIEKLVIWKERKHNLYDAVATGDASCVGALWGCGILKLFQTPSMISHPRLLEYIL